MPIKASFSANCDTCGRYCGATETRQELRTRMRRNGWFRQDGKELCGHHRSFPAGTKVYIAAGVNPLFQGRTYKGVLSLATGLGNTIWECGHKHPQTGRGEDRSPKAAFQCAIDYAQQQGWVVVDPSAL